MSDRNTTNWILNKGKKQTRKIPAQVPVSSIAKFQISSADSDHSVLSDRITSVLNELKSEKLNITVHKLKSLSINNEGKLNALVNVIFEKAVNDLQKAEVYAKLCLQLSTFKVHSVGNESLCFKIFLVEHCQQEFETCFRNNGSDSSQQWFEKLDAIGFWSPSSRAGSTLSDVVKGKKMGTVIFLGHLFKTQMLTLNRIRAVIKKLFSLADEEVWNCLCSLLLLVGGDIEAQKQDLAMCLMKMQELANKRQLPSTAKEQLKRVIECRRNKWRQVEIVNSSALKPYPLRLSEDHQEDDSWALGTLSHVVVPRRVMRNQLRQAKNRFNE